MSTAAPYDALVAAHGLSRAHRLMIDAVAPGSRVLDVGCATGYLGSALAARGCTVVGVEANPAAAAQARARGVLEATIVGSVDDDAVRGQVAAYGPYDVIVFGDVLEHLPTPEATLRALVGGLTADGRVVVSLPNVGHWTARRQLVRGRFPREAHGLFDATHLRWFTRASAHDLFRDAGLQVTAEAFAPAPLPLQAHVAPLRRLEDVAVRARPELFALQIVLSGRREP